MRAGSKVSDVIAMEIEVKGSTEPYQVLLEPYAIIIPGELYVFTTTRKRFTVFMWLKPVISNPYVNCTFNNNIRHLLWVSDVELQQNPHLFPLGEAHRLPHHRSSALYW